MTVPTVDGMIVTEQLEVVLLTPARVHGVPVNDPAAVPVLVKATVPPGTAGDVDVSFTNDVHVTL